jgi:2-methylcitrate dehydratase
MKTVDGIQQRLVEYTCRLRSDDLPAEVIHAAKVRVIDTLGALIGGFHGVPCGIVRRIAARVPDPGGATVIGTAIRTTPDMAAFVNGTTARYVEMNDVYHAPGSSGGHPSDVVMPVLAAAEHARAGGRQFIAAVVLGYEIYLRLSDAIHTEGFDCANFACLGVAAAAGKLLGLSADELAHAISMAAVPGNILRQVQRAISRCGRRWRRERRADRACSPRCSRARAWTGRSYPSRARPAGAVTWPASRSPSASWAETALRSRFGTR